MALERAGGNVARAARLLGLKRGAMRYRMEKLGISRSALDSFADPMLSEATELQSCGYAN
jgi:hypothetical protein